MRASQFLITTTREAPQEAEITSHQLMIRSGMIHRLASGLYGWLPMGFRILEKIRHIVDKTMQEAGALPILMTLVQPAKSWEKSGRWSHYGKELLRLQDRHDQAFCLGPTHEEMICELAKHSLKSYRQLPINFYQIQTKFRDEVRPRFGLMRAREFIMKDAYSFHLDQNSLEETYQRMYQSYCQILDQIGVRYIVVSANTGQIGGLSSHEFHILAETGEDLLAVNETLTFAANREEAACLAPEPSPKVPEAKLQKIHTPELSRINEISHALDQTPSQGLKILIVEGQSHTLETPELIALALRGDHTLNPLKAEKLPQVRTPLTFASEEALQQANLIKGFIGPKDLNLPIIADLSAAQMSSFSAGANEKNYHYQNLQWSSDCAFDAQADLRFIESGDPSPNHDGYIKLSKGIEVGHIFQLGDQYSRSMKVNVMDQNGKTMHPMMGCYGLGVSRLVPAVIEQMHDDKGICWPDSIAPFQIVIAAFNYNKSDQVRAQADSLYAQLQSHGYDTLLDDRTLHIGEKLADLELLGIPHVFIVSERGLKSDQIEYRKRQTPDTPINIPLLNCVNWITEQIKRPK